MGKFRVAIILFSWAGTSCLDVAPQRDYIDAVDGMIRYELIYYDNPRITPELVHAIISVESHYHPGAVSHKDCMGLMQIGHDLLDHYNTTHRTQYKPQDLFVDHINIKIGIWYLDFLSKRKRTAQAWITAYNYGPYHCSPRPTYYFKVKESLNGHPPHSKRY